MTEKRQLKAENSVLIYVIAFLIMQIGAMVLAYAFPDGGNAYIFLAYTLPQVLYIGVTFVYIKATKTEFRLLPEREKVAPVHYLAATLIGLGVFFFALLPNYGIQKLFALMGKSPEVTVPDLNNAGYVVAALITMCVLPAIGEELMFRKVFCDGFKGYGNVVAILLSGFLFGLSHLNLAQTVHQVFLGCLLAYLYLKTDNITLTSLIHFLNNVFALFLSGITGEEFWNNIITLAVSCAIGLAVLAGGLTIIIKKAPRLSLEKGAKPGIFVLGFTALMVVLWVVAAIVV